MTSAAGYFQLGHGDAANGSAAARFDDLFIYDRALVQNEVKGLNSLVNRVYDFSPEAVGIEEVKNEGMKSEEWDDTVYDLSGRIVHRTSSHGTLPRGLYIINGRKVLVK